jgi:diacylglycerol kinase family enzyme
VRRLEVRSPDDQRVYVQVDGEFAGRLPARVEIIESALTLLMPADARQRLAIKVTEALLPAAG